MNHYLQLQLTTGKETFDRVYFPLAHPDETVEEATERWLDTMVAGRQRNIGKTRRAWAAKIELARLCHPTSWHRDNETGAFAPKTLRRMTRSRRRRR